MPITTVEQVKKLLQISGSTYDVYIDTMLPIVESQIQAYCNLTDELASAEVGLKLPAAQMINFHLLNRQNISSEKIGNYSVAYSSTDYPKTIINSLKNYRRVKFIPSADTESWASTWHDFRESNND